MTFLKFPSWCSPVFLACTRKPKPALLPFHCSSISNHQNTISRCVLYYYSENPGHPAPKFCYRMHGYSYNKPTYAYATTHHFIVIPLTMNPKWTMDRATHHLAHLYINERLNHAYFWSLWFKL